MKCQDIARDHTVLSVHIYDMGTSLNAFGIYRTECGAVSNPLNSGAEAAIFTPVRCSLLKGKYYVKIYTVKGVLDEELGISLLKSITSELHGSEKLPLQLAKLPNKNRRVNSEGFTLINFLGLSELKNCVHAEYNAANDPYQLFMVVDNGVEKAEAVWKSLAEFWKLIDSGMVRCQFVPGIGLIGIKKTHNAYLGITGCKNEEDLKSKLDELT